VNARAAAYQMAEPLRGQRRAEDNYYACGSDCAVVPRFTIAITVFLLMPD
jgi:hypothetical protein